MGLDLRLPGQAVSLGFGKEDAARTTVDSSDQLRRQSRLICATLERASLDPYLYVDIQKVRYGQPTVLWLPRPQ